jgi:hypothetical protein
MLIQGTSHFRGFTPLWRQKSMNFWKMTSTDDELGNTDSDEFATNSGSSTITFEA